MRSPAEGFYLISGFHRSGTSLLAQIAQDNGLALGNDLMGASFANPQGHREDTPLVELHDNMLNSLGTDWRCIDSPPLVPSETLIDELAQYVTSRQKNMAGKLVGGKDPRALHFYEAWQQATHGKVKAILVFRDWRYSVSSLMKRHSRELLHSAARITARDVDLSFWRYPELAAKMWLASSHAICHWLKESPQNTLAFPLEALINQPPELEIKCREKQIPAKLLSLTESYTPGLLQTAVPGSLIAMLPAQLVSECDAMLESLKSLAGFTDSQESIRIIDSYPLTEKVLEKAGQQRDAVPAADVLRQQFITKLSVEDALDVLDTLDEAALSSFPWSSLLASKEANDKTFERLYKAAMRHHRPDIAEPAIQRALLLKPAPWRWMYLGDLYLAQNHLSLSEHCYQNARQSSPENATFLARLADVATARGEWQEAQSLIDQAKVMDATKPAIKSAENKLARAIGTPPQATHTQAPSLPGIMPVVTDPMSVVEAMTANSEKGQILDDYLVRYAFIRRDNASWLAEGLKDLSTAARRCLLDYLIPAMSRYWPETVLHTELLREKQVMPTKEGLFLSGEKVSAQARVGVHLHVYYVHLLPELVTFLENMPEPFRLIVTCTPEEVSRVSAWLPAQTRVIGTKNRGRDIGPWILHAAPLLEDCELVLKLHTKETPHDSALAGWRLQLLWSLLGSSSLAARNVERLRTQEGLGILLPPYHPAIVKDIHWGNNYEQATKLAEKLHFSLPDKADKFPAGSMFWYRPDSLKPLLDHHWTDDDFPEENGQTDGTVMHAIERILVSIAESRSFKADFIHLL